MSAEPLWLAGKRAREAEADALARYLAERERRARAEADARELVETILEAWVWETSVEDVLESWMRHWGLREEGRVCSSRT